jgi:hypothetical protein
MTPEELEIFEALGDIYTRFVAEKAVHINEQSEFAYHIHMLQNMILARETYRKYLNQMCGDKRM